MKTIHKYSLENGELTVFIPEGSEVLSVINQNGIPVMYVLVDTSVDAIKYVKLSLIGTGWSIDDRFLIDYRYLTTVNCEPLVWHVFINKEN